MAPPSHCPRSPPAMMEELVEEILLRIPPDEPAHLFRAALVCKPWRRILSDPGFLHRYCALHRAPLLLGYFHNVHHNSPGPAPRFVSTTTASLVSPPLTADGRSGLTCWTHDCRHGRVLIEVTGGLIVWDPITGDQKKLSVPRYPHSYYTGTVLCAVDGCDHLDCHAGAFHVVYCGTGHDEYNQHKTWATMYSSETGLWSSVIYIDDVDYYVEGRPALMIGNALYFSLQHGISLLKYDLRRRELSMIDSPCALGSVPMELDDGELGFVAILDDHCIYMWSWQADANNGIGRWEQHMVMELQPLLPKTDLWPEVIGLIEGTYTVFISDASGVFTLDIKSRTMKKVGKPEAYYRILPYVSFYTPGLPKGILSPT